MTTRLSSFVVPFLALMTMALAAPASAAAETYDLDLAHSSFYFHIGHAGVSRTHGRFNEARGTITADPANPANTSFDIAINATSVDTGNEKRDNHLRSPDFLDVKQFPAMTFKSTKVEKAEDGLTVTGNLTIHGQTRSITLTMKGGTVTEMPPGVKRIGYTGEFTINRSDYGMDKMLNAVSDDVVIAVSFEGTRK